MLMIRGAHYESDTFLLLFALPAYVNCNHRLEKEGGRGRGEGEGGERERLEGGRGRREGEGGGREREEGGGEEGKGGGGGGGEGGGRGRRGNYMIRDGRRRVYMHCMQYSQGSPMALH